MKSELVDVINKNNDVIGKEGMRKCHENGLWHRTSGIFIFNDGGELLLQKRFLNMSIGPGKYECSASGHVGSGETFKQGAYKELKEELGVETDLELIAENIIENFDESWNKTRHLISLFKGVHNGSFEIQESELDSIKFWSISEIKKEILNNPNKFTDCFKQCFNIYINKK